MIYSVTIDPPDDLEAFRSTARRLLAGAIAPSDVAWHSEQTPTLFVELPPCSQKTITVPRTFVDLAEVVLCHRDERCHALLYEALWRISLGERALMEQAADPLVHRLRRMAAAVKHDQHRMTAFLRFREVTHPDSTQFIAWYEPQHRILRRTKTFFIDRFTNMRFSILTPDLTLYWDGQRERFAPGLRREDAASADAVEDWWRRYYSAIFNPARINTRLMQSHMPKQYWRDLPEASAILELIQQAGARTERMVQPLSARDLA